MNKLRSGMLIVFFVVAALSFPLLIMQFPYIAKLRFFCGVSKSYLMSFYGGYLTFVGSTVLGIVAYRQSKISNQISKKLFILENSERRCVLEYDSTNEILLYYQPDFDNRRHSSYRINATKRPVILTAYGRAYSGKSIVFVFRVTNISSVHIKEVCLVGLSFTFNYFTVHFESLYSNTTRLIKPNECVEVQVSIGGFLISDDKLEKSLSSIRFKLKLRVTSIYMISTYINIGVSAERIYIDPDHHIYKYESNVSEYKFIDCEDNS